MWKTQRRKLITVTAISVIHQRNAHKACAFGGKRYYIMSIAKKMTSMQLEEIKTDFDCSYSSLHANRAQIRREQERLGHPLMDWTITTGKGKVTVKRTS